MALASELQKDQRPGEDGASSSGLPTWLAVLIPISLSAALAAAAVAVVLRRRRRRRTARQAQHTAACGKGSADGASEEEPLTPHSGKMDRMESGEFPEEKLGSDSGDTRLSRLNPSAGSHGSDASGGVVSGGSTAVAPHTPDSALTAGHRSQDKLWRARCVRADERLPLASALVEWPPCRALSRPQLHPPRLAPCRFTGALDGLEIGELLGRGGEAGAPAASKERFLKTPAQRCADFCARLLPWPCSLRQSLQGPVEWRHRGDQGSGALHLQRRPLRSSTRAAAVVSGRAGTGLLRG